MASVPNRVYPENEYGEIRTNTMMIKRANTGSTTTIPASYITLTGFEAQGSIAQFQPVVFSRNHAGTIIVSGASVWGAGGIIGVAAQTVTDGNTCEVILRGFAHYISSGATVISSGSPIIWAHSGSNAIANYVNAPGLTSGSSIIGYVVTAGAAESAAACTVWVQPQTAGVG